MNRARIIFILGKLAQMLGVLWAIVTILFLLFRLMPGNPLVAYIDPTFTEEQAAAVRHEFGLDQPLQMQYVLFLRNTLKGNLGTSFFQKEPVFDVLMDVFPNTL